MNPPPNATAQLFNLAVRHFNANQKPEATAVCREILKYDSCHVDALHMLGLLESQAGRHKEAIALIRQALAIHPRDPVLHNNLAEALRNDNQDEASLPSYREAIRLAPKFPEPYFNMGNILKKLGRIEDALAAYRRAIESRPDYGKARFNLANVLREEGRVKTAVIEYEVLVKAQPDWCDAHLNLANTYLELGEPDKALVHYQRVKSLDATNEEIDVSLAHAHLALGQTEAARQCYQCDILRRPNRPLAKLRTESLCEVVPPSTAYIADFQARLARVYEQAIAEPRPFELKDLQSSGAEPPMSLAYHGGDVRPLIERHVNIFAGKIPHEQLAPRHGKPKMGIVVTHGHEGVFARCWSGIAERLSRERFDVRLICSRAGSNVMQFMTKIHRAEHFVLPDGLDKAAAALRDERFDLLHYWEIGTDSTNCFLPYFRTAPVQSSCWGWPATSGNPAVEYYVSSKRLEPDGATQQFSEQLIQLDSLPSFYERPALPSRMQSRSDLGLPERERIYFCTQNVRKYHPEFDAILADILRSDPEGWLFIIADSQSSITDLLLARFRRTMPDVAARVRVLPRQERPEYLNVLALADVALDTLHYGGGANTVYDACSVGTPMVTLPGRFQRGRWTMAVCNRLEITDTIATSPEDYARRAVQIASEPDLRQSLKAQLLERCPSLFEDRQVIREHEEFFAQAIETSRSN